MCEGNACESAEVRIQKMTNQKINYMCKLFFIAVHIVSSVAGRLKHWVQIYGRCRVFLRYAVRMLCDPPCKIGHGF